MVFWAGVLVAAAFAWRAIKIGFYETWTFAFNILISVYLAIFLGPVIADILPVTGESTFGIALTMAGMAIAAFLILHNVSVMFFMGQFNISFMKVLDIFGSGFIGFLAGLLVWSFASLLIFMTPISKSGFVKEVGFTNQLKQANISYVSFWCNLVNKVVSTQANPCSTEDTINEALNKTEPEKKTTGQPGDVELDEAERIDIEEDSAEITDRADTKGY